MKKNEIFKCILYLLFALFLLVGVGALLCLIWTRNELLVLKILPTVLLGPTIPVTIFFMVFMCQEIVEICKR